MSKNIAIHISFYNDRWEKMISDGVRAMGYAPRFLNTDEVRLEDISDCEILFGMFPPELLAQCPNLRWLQCSFAGVDKYTKPGTFVRPDAVLTNASGAYGITIAEHMICVLLMMMRRMPEYQALIA
jgi:phosphoglycerate dehydrogenase-like enzyme